MTDLEFSGAIYGVFKDLGCSLRLAGYRYAAFGLELLYKSGGRMQMTTELYPQIAKEFASTPARVERAIRHFIKDMMDNAPPETLREVFGSTNRLESGIRNSDFFYSVMYYIVDRGNAPTKEG